VAQEDDEQHTLVTIPRSLWRATHDHTRISRYPLFFLSFSDFYLVALPFSFVFSFPLVVGLRQDW
jgi:hypothetical protein